MRIAVLSDTHAYGLANLPQSITDALRAADLIVHLGDYTEYRMLADLRATGPFRGVAGNMDALSIHAELPERDIIEMQGKKIGMTHGNGSPTGIVERVRALFPDDIDAVLYGHSHQALNQVVDGTLMFNPGSPTRPFPGYAPSFGILTIDEGGIRGEIVTI